MLKKMDIYQFSEDPAQANQNIDVETDADAGINNEPPDTHRDFVIYTRLQDLLDELQLNPEALKYTLLPVSPNFPLKVPAAFVKRIKKGDPDDPLLKQILPIESETTQVKGFLSDPVADLQHQVAPGLIHKYANRALLIATGACSIHCRYCFRREYPYEEASISDNNLDAVIDYLQNHKNIQEIILSGGDPLTLSNRRLGKLLDKLASIPHLKSLRIHSRQAIAMPERIDQGLIDMLSKSRFKTCMVIHCNHANEIDQTVIKQLSLLRQAGIMLLNQSVLLKGVNDNVQTLCNLSEKLYQAGVLPYYINALDRVQGSAHFLVEDEDAKNLVNTMRESLPGYLVPRLVKDIPGKKSKTILA